MSNILQEVEDLFKRYGRKKSDKDNWNDHYQQLAEHFMTRKAHFTDDFSPGEFLNDDLFDGTPSNLAKTAASVLFGMLWPNGARSIRIEPADELEDPTSEERKFFEKLTKIMHSMMDHPNSGLQVALSEYHWDNVVFGTSSIYPKKGKNHPVVYSSWNVKNTCIEQGEDGRVNAIFHEEKLTIRQIVERYGEEKLSKRMQDKIKQGLMDDKENVLFAIVPRIKAEAKAGVLAMSFISYHVEVEGKHLIKRGGFDRFPVPTNRFMQAMNEVMGRSLCMDALPDAQELQIVRESDIVGTEMQLYPPLAVHDDGSLGLGSVDTSPRAINVFHVTGKLNGLRPVEPLFTMGDIRWTKERIEALHQSISNHLMLDRLLDLNNDVQMTLGEAQIRDRIRSFSLMSVFSRQILELYEPLVRLTFDILFEQGLLGVVENSEAHIEAVERGEDPLIIPDRVAKIMEERNVENAYKVRYITPASRLLRAETIEGILRLWQATSEIAKVSPEVTDKPNADKSLDHLSDLLGVPEDVLNDDKTVKNIRKIRAERQAEQVAMMQQEMQAGIVKTASEAERNAA